jgi:hypothetical protein
MLAKVHLVLNGRPLCGQRRVSRIAEQIDAFALLPEEERCDNCDARLNQRSGPRAPVPLAPARADELRRLIAGLDFVFARTMPHIPHEYVVLSEANRAAFLELRAAILRHGIPLKFSERRYRYLFPGDGWKYWMVWPSPLINRDRTCLKKSLNSAK